MTIQNYQYHLKLQQMMSYKKHFDYYDETKFKKLTSGINISNSFSIFHTNLRYYVN